MVYKLIDTEKAAQLFEGWQETLIYSCLQGIMGGIYVTDTEAPKSAYAYVGCFAFYAGSPDEELLRNKPEGFVIMTPQNEAWGLLIESCFPNARKVTRYAIRKDTVFDEDHLQKLMQQLPQGYELRQIDSELYDQCVKHPQFEDFVSAFASKEEYLQKGLGIVAVKDGQVVAGASSYTRYEQGIEIEVDTVEGERRKHLATACCSALILECLRRGWYPSWDAQNRNSVRLSEKLGYEFWHEYTAYEVWDE